MCGMKTLLAATALCLTVISQALPARAGIADAEQQLRTFATCAGRLSAQMEWQWMFDGEGSETTQHQRATVIELLRAVMPDGRGREVLAWRINAKVAHRALLTRASFNDDPGDAAWALETATNLTADCTALLLS